MSLSREIIWPSRVLRAELAREREIRLANQPNRLKARGLGLKVFDVSLGVSKSHYHYFCLLQNLYHMWEYQIHLDGLQNIPQEGPTIFIMKHRCYADISLHGMAHLLATSKNLPAVDSYFLNKDLQSLKEISAQGKPCRFIMKEDLLLLPIGLHLILNGGIPVSQDLETKALNTPGFDPHCSKVVEHTKKMLSWFSFKQSYREILKTLADRKSIMLYGEATRVSGNKMGHLSMKFLKQMSRNKDIVFIPVGSTLNGNSFKLHYGESTSIENLRDAIADLSEIPKKNYLK